ncbi:MAG: serine hydrolase [Cyclobacteriaceae bacterium]
MRVIYCVIIGFCCLACQQKSDSQLEQLENEIGSLFSSTKGSFAIAFKNLSDTTDVILINEHADFHAASTMKVPVMIELYRQARQGQFALDDSLTIKNEFASIVDGSPYSLDSIEDSERDLYNWIGQKKSIYDLNNDMIIWSSNLATNLLIELVDAKATTETMRGLGAENIQVLRGVEDIKAYEQGLSNSSTANDLMVIFESLAQGEACPQSDCEEMIDILKDQRFNEIIPALLPENVEVAHKTGSITALHHDAGIVYLPDGRHYVLVILSKNLEDVESATQMMAGVSRLIYDYMITKAN